METLIENGVSCLPSLIEALRINDHDIRFNIIKILGSIGDQRVTEHLVELVEDAPESLQYEITEALARLKDSRSIDALITTLSHKEPGTRELASNGLVDLGPAALPALCTALNSPLWQTRSYAARILGRIKDLRAVEPLIEALDHPDSTFRIEVIKALGVLGDARAVPLLINTLHENEQELVQPLIESLAILNDVRAIPSMMEALKTEVWNKHKYIVDDIFIYGP